MTREERIAIFEDTLDCASSLQYEKPSGDYYDFKPVGEPQVYTEKPKINYKVNKVDKTDVLVIDNDCLYVARDFVKDGNKCAVLNMASFIRPGGGVRGGSAAQEESLFRRTNLCMSLYRFTDDMYQITHVDKPIKDVYPLPMNFGAIYSPNITVFRDSDRTGKCDYLEDPFIIDVMTVAAVKRPPLKPNGKLYDWVLEVIDRKARMMLDMCIINNVDVPILGAFGCGAYATPPDQVAEVFKKVLESPEYHGKFKTIVFAIIDDHNSHKEHNPRGNFLPFSEISPKEI